MMERALKERIIGAAILVAVVILVVPVFLDGPPAGDAVVSTSVPLPGQTEQNTQTVVLDRDRKDPVPVAGSTSGGSAETDAVVTESKPLQIPVEKPPEKPVEKPVEEPVEIESAPVTAVATVAPEKQPSADPKPQILPGSTNVSTTGMWAVQLGSFSDQKNADRLAADLRKQGFAAFLSDLPTESGKLHRVRVGPQKDRASADAMAERLQKAGHDGKVLPHP